MLRYKPRISWVGNAEEFGKHLSTLMSSQLSVKVNMWENKLVWPRVRKKGTFPINPYRNTVNKCHFYSHDLECDPLTFILELNPDIWYLISPSYLKTFEGYHGKRHTHIGRQTDRHTDAYENITCLAIEGDKKLHCWLFILILIPVGRWRVIADNCIITICKQS